MSESEHEESEEFHSDAEERIMTRMSELIREGFSRMERMLALKEKKVLIVSEAASLLNVTSLTVRRWLEEGKLKGTKSGPHKQAKWYINQKDIDKFMESYTN